MKLNVQRSDIYIQGKLDRLNRLDFSPWPFPLRLSCNIKILMVTDSAGKYTPGGFGLSTFLKAFDEPLPYTSFNVTTAHRSNGGNGADIKGFRFDNHNLDQYDVIFIFAVSNGAEIPNTELKALSMYMDDGGGVFATGDHADLGVSICGQLPRVKSMRRWYVPLNPGPNGEPFAPLVSGDNHDTIVDPSVNVSGSQGDLITQKIDPVYKYRFVSPAFQGSNFYRYVKYPHPVLCSTEGIINRLPDHMHEGLCEVPKNLTWAPTFDGYTIKEYPFVGGARLKPNIVAYAKDHNGDKKFGVICALDGHKHASIGRVLVDATWHHFFDINIGQLENLKVQVDGGHVPNNVEIDALESYNQIQHYYRNVAYWLARRDTQKCFRIRGWKWVIQHYEISMHINANIAKMAKQEKILYFHNLGTVAKNALGDLQSECQSRALFVLPDWAFDHKEFDIGSRVRKLSYVDPRIFETVCFGCSIHNLHTARIDKKKELSDKEIDSIVEESRIESATSLLDSIGNSISGIRRRVNKHLKKRKKR